MPVVHRRGIPVPLRSFEPSCRAGEAGLSLPRIGAVALAWKSAAAADIARTAESGG